MTINYKILVRFWLPIPLYIGLIFFMSSLSFIPFALPKITNFDKIMHMTEYAILAVLLARAVNSAARPSSLWLRLLICVGLVVVFGSLDEIYQSTVPNRQSDIWDLAADSLGGFLGSGLFFLIINWRRKKTGGKTQDSVVKPEPTTLAGP